MVAAIAESVLKLFSATYTSIETRYLAYPPKKNIFVFSPLEELSWRG